MPQKAGCRFGDAGRAAECEQLRMRRLRASKAFTTEGIYEGVGVVKGKEERGERGSSVFFPRLFESADQGSLPSNPAVVCSTSHLFGLKQRP